MFRQVAPAQRWWSWRRICRGGLMRVAVEQARARLTDVLDIVQADKPVVDPQLSQRR
jgi:hypothetical protein